MRFGLSVIGYRRLSRILPCSHREQIAAPWVRLRCAWALTAAARWVPGASCLTQALAGRCMLHELGYGSRVIVGVAPNADGRGFRAHAWLEIGDEVVVGGAEALDEFSRLTELGAE